MKDSDKTIVQIFFDRVRENGDTDLFIYHEEGDFPPFTYNGKLRTMTWSEAAEQVKQVGMGLMALGAKKGEPVSIMANTSHFWVLADLGLLSIGGQTGSIYPNNTPSQAQYILNDLNSRFVFVEGEERRDALLRIVDKSPQLERIITIRADGGGNPLCMSFDELLELGRSESGTYSAAFDEAVATGTLSDVASYIYTSGTTGAPKGAVHTHESITYTVCTGAEWLPIEPGWTDLSFLPMAHIFEQFAGAFLDIYRGNVKVAFARSVETVAQDFAFVKPHYSRSAPRLFEKVFSAVHAKADVLLNMSPDALKDALEVARRVVVEGGLEGRPVSEDDKKKFQKIDQEHFKTVRDLVFGGNMQFFVSGGAPFSKEINEFMWCLGLPVYELYGMTETGGATTNRPGKVKLGTVGMSWPGDSWPGGGGETKLSQEGELLMRGPNVMVGYHNKPEETAEALKDGWMYSGDVAQMDEDGFFTITDRIKDIIITAGGKNVAPVGIEGALKEHPLVSQAVVYGDRKKYLTALITLDEVVLAELAKQMGLEGTYRQLTQHPAVTEVVKKIIDDKNRELAKFETIKQFVVLDHDLSIEAGDLTPTLKVKRREVFKKYGDMVEKLYTD